MFTLDEIQNQMLFAHVPLIDSYVKYIWLRSAELATSEDAMPPATHSPFYVPFGYDKLGKFRLHLH